MREKLKIGYINPGIISIPPKGWGAIEKIVWNYKLNLESRGHTVDVIDPPWIEKNLDSYDIIHVHVFNQAIELKDSFKMPYIFSLHDHHAYIVGKEQGLFKENLRAMKQSIISITHAEYLMDFFSETDKLFYLPHGVDTKKYEFRGKPKYGHKLLCVANNGLVGRPTVDRKGFRYAIEAAKKLDLPITIAGPKNNHNFFNANPDLKEYEKLTIIDEPDEDELINIYNDHTIFIHPSDLEAGHPNLTLVESLSCGLPIVGTYKGKDDLDGLIKCERNTLDVYNKIKYVIANYDELQKKALETAQKYDWTKITDLLEQIYYNVIDIKENFTNKKMTEKIVDIYDNSHLIRKEPKEPKIDFNVTFNEGPRIDISRVHSMNKEFHVDFIDKNDMVSLFGLDVGMGQWAKANRKWFTNWRISLKDKETNEIKDIDFNAEYKNVLIQFESRSLGDTIAWFPYVEEFRKKHNCIMYCATHHNYFFEKSYPDINFIPIEGAVNNLYATYKIGWFSPPWGGNRDFHPNDFRNIPLQKTASDILGIKHKEIRPKIDVPESERPISEKYICVAEHSTAQAKYWNYPNGWQILVDKLVEYGYKVVVISKESTNLKNVIDKTGLPLTDTMTWLKHCEFMITISSGLSWLAWAMNKLVVMISGFSKPEFEFQSDIIRIHDSSVCNGCFNNLNYEFDRGDWWWCPVNKDTDKHFICSKVITPEIVINKIKQFNLLK
jgi:autotransporter strand-loop-strand O-heptosyltransferase